MKPIIDLTGASGAIYRFRLIESPAQLPATGGNFVFVRSERKNDQVVGCGVARSLTQAGEAWPDAVAQHRTNRIYVRLNVARALREAEHEDLVAGLQPALVLPEPA